jgi:trans-2,3-dihydro-3-hydroxyanthranilate isomerase
MQQIARELNLTETVFALPATSEDCAARLRIFTPVRETPFAGHPTVGAAFVLLQEEIIARGTAAFLLEEQIGPVPVRIEGGERPLIWLRTPPICDGRYLDRACLREGAWPGAG